MISSNIVTAIYIAASVLFILSLGGLSNQESAKRAVWFGIVGMALAVGATILGPQVSSYNWLIPMIALGSIIGLLVARRVEMTGMPQLVAALHSFVGLAAVFIGINSELAPPTGLVGAEIIIHEVEIFVGVFIGAVTTTGSIVAFGKLAGFVGGKPLTLPGRNILNLLAVFACIWLGAMYLNHAGIWTLYLMTAIAFIFGAHGSNFVQAILGEWWISQAARCSLIITYCHSLCFFLLHRWVNGIYNGLVTVFVPIWLYFEVHEHHITVPTVTAESL